MPDPRIEGCSLGDFNNRLIDLFQQWENTHDEAAFHNACFMALRGIDRENGIQYSVEPLRNRMTQPCEMTTVRDYDSMIAFTTVIPITQDVFLYPVSNPINTLNKSIHMKVPMTLRHGQVSDNHILHSH